MQQSFITWLDHWQTLIGAFIGGITGFIAAQLIATNTRMRDEVISAKLLITNLLPIEEKTRMINASIEDIENQNKKLEFVLRYLKRKPILSSLFDSSMATVLSCNYALSLHLSSFKIVYSNIEDSLKIKIKFKAITIYLI